MQSAGIKVEVKGEREFKQAITNINTATKSYKTELEALNTTFDKNATAMEKTKAKREALTTAIEKQKEKVDSLKAALQDAESTEGVSENTINRAKTALANAEIQLSSFQEELKKTNGWTTFGEHCESVGNGLVSIGEKLTDVGEKLTKFITVPIIGAFTAATKGALDYEDGLAKVYTIADDSVVPIEDMEDALLALSSASGKSAGELAEATYQALSAGVSTERAADFVSTAADLSKAGFLETANAVDVLTTIINAYGYSSEDAANIADQLVQTQNDGKTTVDQLAQSMGQIIPTASALNVPFEQLNSAYVLMTKQGINTANATTYLNGMFTELADGGSDVAAILQDKTGMTFGQLMESGYSLGDILGILSESVDGNGEAFLNLWGNVRAGRGALSIVNGGIEEFNAEIDSMENATGNVSTALETLNTPAAKARKAFNSLKNAGIEIGERFAPYIEKAANVVQQLIDKWDALDPATQDNIIKFALAAAAVGPLISAIGSVITTIGMATISIGGIATAIGAAGGLIPALGALLAAAWPVIAVIAGITAVVIGVIWAVKHWGEITEWISGVWETVKTSISNAITLIQLKITAAWNKIKTATTKVWNSVKTFISTTWNTIKTTVQNALTLVQLKITAIWNSIKTATTNAWNAVKTFITTTWDNIKTTITNTLNNIWTGITTAWNNITTTVSMAVTNVWNTISTGFTNAWTSVTTIFNGIWTSISTALTGAWTTVSTTVSSIWSTISTAFTGAWYSVSSIFTNIYNTIYDKIWGAYNTVSSAIDWIKGLFNFEWSLPSIKLPHFSWTWTSIGGLISIPNISVSWYKKAYTDPMLFNSPTVLGTAGGMKGFGDGHGGEVVIGQSMMYGMIRDAVSEGSGVTTSNTWGDINIVVNGAEGQDVRELADLVADRIAERVQRRKAAFA